MRFFKKIKSLFGKDGGKMRMKNTVRVMSGLRELNARIRKNNLRINEWVDDYLNWCVLNGEPINILTQWCISKDLEERFNRQGGRFLPTRKERRLFPR